MHTILSPAKNMRTDCAAHPVLSRPAFADQAARLVRQLQTYSPWQLESLLQVNPQLALSAWEMFAQFDPQGEGTAALTSYHGLQYQNLEAATLTPEQFAFAQEHLRILSGLYGVLRPGDGILPYRLEMQTRLAMEGEKNLYAWWGDSLYRALFAAGEPVINLASAEYSRAVRRWLAPGDVLITCDFLVRRRGKLQMLPTAAKMARGQMARFILTQGIDRPEDLQDFRWGEYVFVPGLSSGEKYTFVQGWDGEQDG